MPTFERVAACVPTFANPRDDGEGHFVVYDEDGDRLLELTLSQD